MRYQQIQAPEHLKNHIRYFWTLESDSLHTSAQQFTTIADGCPGLIFQHADYGKLSQFDKKMPGLCLYGQTTKYAQISLSGRFNTIGVYFYPSVLRSVFGISADELTDSCIDMNLLPGIQANFESQLLQAVSVPQKVSILSACIAQQIKLNNKANDSLSQFALLQIIGSKGIIPLSDLQQNLKLSERSFERRFKQYVGISPKLFSRICRFQSSLSQLRSNDYDKLTDVAYQNEYADQSHFIRAFKEFAGVSPYQYQKKSNEIVENLAAMNN
ncbi:hypothetical protein GCM10023149_17870 [Mucilaginibacter gynuensis]|uniref:HTH araC/xylS-type domain-containing protein n=1 Tax=Mucilaginibacter gynuensis TaxID=1302236 RepID=A0ABP8G8Q3_9SPHI